MREGVYRFASDRRPGLKKKFGINLSKSIKNLCMKSILNSGGFEVTEEPSDTPRSILIEFPADDSEMELVSLRDLLKNKPEKVKEKSEKAVAEAMESIVDMAYRIDSLRDRVPKEFSTIEVEFGIKFNWEVGALLTKAGSEANINVTLTWTKPQS
jgi:hypothetical protein